MKLRDLALNDILLIDGIAYTRSEWFACEDSAGDPYYRLEGSVFKKFSGYEQIEHFSDNVYILNKETK
jgi:hypothetical protein